MGKLLVGEYLLKRVKELGVESVFGVPGDFELAFLDLVLSEGLSWKGNPNELVAGYAADGYARRPSSVTTFGPGETSALCAIAGAYTEFVPVVHIVGYPSMKAQRAHAIPHHTLGEGKFHNYHEMSKQICCATTVLEDGATAASEIDRVLNAMMLHSQPVYIGIPTDVTFEKIPSHGLLVPLTTTLDPNNQSLEDKILADIREQLEKAQSGIILVDGGAARHGVLPEVEELIDVTGFPFFTTPMGKGSVNENRPGFGGVYVGQATKPDVKHVVESADCVLRIGNYPADLNTGEFTTKLERNGTIDFDRFFVMLGSQKYNLKMKPVLQKLNRSLKIHPLSKKPSALQCKPYGEVAEKGEQITQNWIWPQFGKFLREGDLLIVETGTSSSGINAAPLPGNITMWTQEVFGSIGYATGAMVGATVANKEKGGKRSILITGDGSLQLTIQAFADLLKHGTNPHIFVINNDGYTVERVVHGLNQPYNDIPMWKYAEALKFFGPDFKSESHLVRTPDELEKLLNDPEFAEPTHPKLVEIVMDKYDAPQFLLEAGKAIHAFNAGKTVVAP